jgi:hypothetical protein
MFQIMSLARPTGSLPKLKSALKGCTKSSAIEVPALRRKGTSTAGSNTRGNSYHGCDPRGRGAGSDENLLKPRGG